MVTAEELGTLDGREVTDRDGRVLGTVVAVYVDDRTHEPAWAVVRGSDGDRPVPLTGATARGTRLELDVPGDLVRDAPVFDIGDSVATQDELRLIEHYGSAFSPATGPGSGSRSAHLASPTTGPGAPGGLPATEEAASPTAGPGASGDLPPTHPRQSPRTGVGGSGEPEVGHLRRWQPAH
ncbi:PRC-barrel domain-containing protein [Isoptericola sp. b441]|uniref:PRC-barrel domain-containing protein n=1 Tax=Actinotalea lenta TaxID=3064654 RepID=A0ABT9D9G6_9CELL|nr:MULTISPECIES: PRC-barrel domain-containing protein [unclassified Isoptericola]MDO8105823.1 PRC-barrel domain-containing protein [Isoptericola sp. b441]MDO8122528.1 PRC-barrel domain-containing protein [Isoptericola sp. b490]